MTGRINRILKQKKLTASQFADQVGIQRSSVSHIMSGRNNPSLDLVQKILNTYQDINPSWLISGKGQMFLQVSGEGMEEQKEENSTQTASLLDTDERDEGTKGSTASSAKLAKRHSAKNDRIIEKIVVFYKNGTFREYKEQ